MNDNQPITINPNICRGKPYYRGAFVVELSDPPSIAMVVGRKRKQVKPGSLTTRQI